MASRLARRTRGRRVLLGLLHGGLRGLGLQALDLGLDLLALGLGAHLEGIPEFPAFLENTEGFTGLC